MTALETAAKPFWRSLYRSVVRECKNLPDAVTSEHFLKNARSTFRSRDVVFSQQEHLLRSLQAANAGYLHALTRCLEQAYGRRGKLKRTKIEHLLREARSATVLPLKPGCPRTRPPIYTPRLQAYLTSSDSYSKGKAPTTNQLSRPPKLPARADPASEEARLLGRLHPRREANIKWRFLSDLRSRLYAPSSTEQAHLLNTLSTTSSSKEARKHKKPNTDVLMKLQENEHRYRKTSVWDRPKRITSRFMRRRYAALLDKSVILENRETSANDAKWVARRPEIALGLSRKAAATEEDRFWVMS